MSEDEVISVLYDNDIYECDCDNDEYFVFVSNCKVVSFAIPAGPKPVHPAIPDQKKS
jgi:hypothetical protein